MGSGARTDASGHVRPRDRDRVGRAACTDADHNAGRPSIPTDDSHIHNFVGSSARAGATRKADWSGVDAGWPGTSTDRPSLGDRMGPGSWAYATEYGGRPVEDADWSCTSAGGSHLGTLVPPNTHAASYGPAVPHDGASVSSPRARADPPGISESPSCREA